MLSFFFFFFFFSSRRRHTRSLRDWSSDVCSSDLEARVLPHRPQPPAVHRGMEPTREREDAGRAEVGAVVAAPIAGAVDQLLPHTGTAGEDAARMPVANSTSAWLPMTSGLFWWIAVGAMSRMRRRPSVAAPPACSTTNASGAAS